MTLNKTSEPDDVGPQTRVREVHASFDTHVTTHEERMYVHIYTHIHIYIYMC